MCQFVDDISTVTELIRQRKDMRVVEERDYITHNKPSGYRSYHMIVEYPVNHARKKSSASKKDQIRTLAINFGHQWNKSLNSRILRACSRGDKKSCTKCSRSSLPVNEEMSSIRSEIQEAQAYFSEFKEASNPSLLSEKERDSQ
ncbi:GTP pyrophosphokinase OS=Lysinibacillus sphaericus OX=1421 GN=yjbM PE=4 SV=1 [Lysinibacillus sphaericus]